MKTEMCSYYFPWCKRYSEIFVIEISYTASDPGLHSLPMHFL